MGKTMKLMLVLAVCTFALTMLAQQQVPATGGTQTPTYPDAGTSGGTNKWGTTPSGAKAMGQDQGFSVDAGQQFNSKWNMVNGNHDLTTNATKGSYWYAADNTTQITVKASALCSFCHTAHDNEGTSDRTFLWAHEVPSTFTAYSSPTLQSTPNTTSTSQTAQCLGCHDGTIAVSSGNYGTPAVNGTTGDSAEYWKLSSSNVWSKLTDRGRLTESTGLIVPLSRTHPVSFTYDATLASKHQLRVPANSSSIDGFGIVPLFYGKMECATCHDPHIKTGIMRRQFPTGASQDAGTGSFCLYCHL